MDIEKLKSKIFELGANRAGVADVSDIRFDRSFRDMCKSNSCGHYGRNWMCPPCVGELDELIERIKTYSSAVVYQTVDELEDSFDYEGMVKAGDRINRLSRAVQKHVKSVADEPFLILGAGGCGICPRCAKLDELPCRFPDEAMSSLEAYGINVSELAKSAGMKYINGQDTVTYFGAVFFGAK